MVRPVGPQAPLRLAPRGRVADPTPTETRRAIVALAPAAEAAPPRRAIADAGLVAQLLAHAEDMAWTRTRRRVGLTEAHDAYRAAARLIAPAKDATTAV